MCATCLRQGDKFYLVKEGTVAIGDVDADIRLNQGVRSARRSRVASCACASDCISLALLLRVEMLRRGGAS